MDLRVREGGGSECSSVMGGIGVKFSGSDRGQGQMDNITSRANGPTSTWSLITRELEKPLKQGRQMTAVATLAGAPCYEVEIDWNRINWKKVNRNVRRLQARSATRSSETAVIDNGGWRARVR
jgi:hypothetical protein